MRRICHLLTIIALCLSGCSALNPGESTVGNELEREFLSWFVADTIENQDRGLGLYSHSLASETSGFPFPRFLSVDDSYSAVIGAVGGGGEENLAAADDYWQKNLTPCNVATLFEVPKGCALVGKASVTGTSALDSSKNGSTSLEQWRKGPTGYLYTISRPGFSRNGNLAVVYIGIQDGALGGGWGEIRLYRREKDKWVESEFSNRCNWVACGLIPRRGNER